MNFISQLAPAREGSTAFSMFPAGTRLHYEVVYLVPDQGISRRSRRIAETGVRTFLNVFANGGPGPAPAPGDFAPATLKWMARIADSIVICWASGGERVIDVDRVHRSCGERGSRRFLTVNTVSAQVPLWRTFLDQWKRLDVAVVEFGPLSSEGGAR